MSHDTSQAPSFFKSVGDCFYFAHRPFMTRGSWDVYGLFLTFPEYCLLGSYTPVESVVTGNQNYTFLFIFYVSVSVLYSDKQALRLGGHCV